MKNKPITIRLTISTLLLLIIISGLLYLIVETNKGEILRHPLDSSYEKTGAYTIDPETILEYLDQGNTDLFKPLLETSESGSTSYTPVATGLYPWNQSDYLKVANALHQFVWKEDVRNWRIYNMNFFKGCQDNSLGFDSAKITYFNTANGLFSYTTRVMDIYPIRNGVSWGGDAKFPRPLDGWESIDLEKLKITADDALQMAERNGASNARLQVENVCTIDIIISPNTDSENLWRITYFSDFLPTGNSVIFKMQIDPYTGEYEIFHK